MKEEERWEKSFDKVMIVKFMGRKCAVEMEKEVEDTVFRLGNVSRSRCLDDVS